MIVVEEAIVAMIVEGGGDENKKQVDCYVFLA